MQNRFQYAEYWQFYIMHILHTYTLATLLTRINDPSLLTPLLFAAADSGRRPVTRRGPPDVRSKLTFATKLVVGLQLLSRHCGGLVSLHGGVISKVFIPRFLARDALIGARRCSSAKRRAAFTSMADSDPRPAPPGPRSESRDVTTWTNCYARLRFRVRLWVCHPLLLCSVALLPRY